jgi:hypothetical protein
MKINFKYDIDQDIWCILNYGKSSNNSSQPTKTYLEIENLFGNVSDDSVVKYITSKSMDTNVEDIKQQAFANWIAISEQYRKIAEDVFGKELKNEISIFCTFNQRCPYNIKQNLFFLSISSQSKNRIIMHELWHFYTWERFGQDWEDKIGKEKYNTIKESLTVLLNVECKDLLEDGVVDVGYPQHKEIRDKILELWAIKKDIDFVWGEIVKILQD